MVHPVILKLIFALINFTFIVSQPLYADEWFCKEGASARIGNTLLICGLGESRSHEDAIIEALRNAKREFKELCEQSEDCQNQKVRITPMRTDCEKVGKFYKCYRSFEYEIGERNSTLEEPLGRIQGNKSQQVIPSGFDLGLDLVSLSSEAFPGLGYFWSIGMNVQYRVKSYGDIELGGDLNIPIRGGLSAPDFDFYVMAPIYLNTQKTANGENTALFFAPEQRFYNFQRMTRNGFGASLGWKTIGSRTGVSFRLGLSNLFDPSGLPPIYSMVLTWPSF